MPRFVVLHHETPAGYPRGPHFDLMLEQNGTLWTWAIDRVPVPQETITAERLPDHRLDYLEYKGEISGNRGRVSRITAGQFELVAYSETQITAQLHGEELCGTLTLARNDHETHLWRVSLTPG